MKTLDELRTEITAIDDELVRLFEQRMRLSAEIGEWKARSGMPVYDPAREEQVMQRCLRQLDDQAYAPYLEAWHRKAMEASRLYQAEWIRKKEGKENG